MSAYSFQVVLIRPEGVGTWTFFYIPIAGSETFGSKGQVKVKGTVNGYPFKSTALPMGDGTHYILIAKSIRDQIHVVHGDTVEVRIEMDIEEREVVIPKYLEEALANHPISKIGFEKLSYSHQKTYVDWI